MQSSIQRCRPSRGRSLVAATLLLGLGLGLSACAYGPYDNSYAYAPGYYSDYPGYYPSYYYGPPAYGSVNFTYYGGGRYYNGNSWHGEGWHR